MDRLAQLLLILLSTIAYVSGSCQLISLENCNCKYPLSKRYEILCQNTGLSALPPKVNSTLNEGFANGNFSYNDIATIPEYYFYNMKHFDILDFTANKISSLNDMTFKGLETRLVSLNMSRNRIESLPLQAFKDYIRLNQLDLSSNLLSSPCKVHTADVVHYSLANNKISRISDQCFTDSAKVEDLNLSHNQISSLGDDAFDGLVSLRKLDLSYNRISDVGNGFNSLVRLSSFESLSLEGNQLQYITSICRYAFPNIKVLSFANNKLADIQKYCFASYASKDTPLQINFEQNQIKSLAASVFAGLEKRLTLIRLNNNLITSVNIDTFKDQQKLAYINLDNNQLDSLEFLRFWDNNVLAELSVSNNAIKELSPLVFSKMSSLAKLALDGNMLVTLETNTFYGMSSLSDLSIRYNLLNNLADHAFNGLGQLKKLKLTGNSLITLKNCTFADLASLTQFHFNDNLFFCDCDLLWLLKVISNVNERGMRAGVSDPVLEDYCHYPEEINGEFLQNRVSESCSDKPPTSCLALKFAITDTDSEGNANLSWVFNSSSTAGPLKSFYLTQTNVESGDIVTNLNLYGKSSPQLLSNLIGDNVYKVCLALEYSSKVWQKDCIIWPAMVKKPTTIAPTTTPMATPAGMPAGSQAAIALAVILIILILLIVLVAVYLWRTGKYRHLIPAQYLPAAQDERQVSSDASQASPSSNGSSKKNPLEFSAAETHPMMDNNSL